MTTRTDTAADAATEPPAAIAFDLKHPFTNAAGVRVERLALRRARRADLRAASQFSRDEFEQETFLFARLSGHTMEDLDMLDLEDNNQLVARFRELAGASRAQP